MLSFFRIGLAVIVFAVLLCTAATAQKLKFSADDIATSGAFKGQLYTNKALDFTMLAPGGWNFFSAEQNAELVAKNRENAQMSGEAELKTAAENTQILFQALPQAVGGRQVNSLFSCGIERLTSNSTVGKYVGFNKDLVLRRSGVTITKDIYSATLGGVKFSAFDVEGATAKGAYRQKYFVTLRKNTALFFVITLYDDKQDAIVEHSLNSIKFGKQ
jgi:hypothetical protein